MVYPLPPPAVGPRLGQAKVQTHTLPIPPPPSLPPSLPPHYSKCYHSHLQLVMEGEKGSDRAAMEAARVILDEVADVLDSRAQVECEGCSSLHVVNRVGWPPVF